MSSRWIITSVSGACQSMVGGVKRDSACSRMSAVSSLTGLPARAAVIRRLARSKLNPLRTQPPGTPSPPPPRRHQVRGDVPHRPGAAQRRHRELLRVQSVDQVRECSAFGRDQRKGIPVHARKSGIGVILSSGWGEVMVMSERTRAEVAAPQHAAVVAPRVAFEDFYAAELPRLVALARGLAPPHLAEDVAQEAMLVAYRRWREIDDLERPDLWVRRTCANLAVSQFRRRLVEVRALARLSGRRQPQQELSPGGEEFWAAVRELPSARLRRPPCGSSMTCRSPTSRPSLGTSEGTVKQHLSRARSALAKTLCPTGGGPVSDLDTLARAATRELLERSTPDVSARYAELSGSARGVRRPRWSPSPLRSRSQPVAGGSAPSRSASTRRRRRAGSSTGTIVLPFSDGRE